MNAKKTLSTIKSIFRIKRKPFFQGRQHKLIGKEAIVIEKIDGKMGTGKVMLGESWWIAICCNRQETIDKGELVRISNVSGFKLIVNKI